jgi:glucosamine-6-phosphate deaminase
MKVAICESKESCGRAAAKKGSAIIREAISKRGRAAIVLATGVSQLELLAELIAAPRLDWRKVSGFHLDEYVGIPAEHPASFKRYLKERFVDYVPIEEFHYIDGGGDIAAELARQNDLLANTEIDVVFLGIGINGHLAFNDPPADFDTEKPFIEVSLDEDCRGQQLSEGWFQMLEDVPRKAISMSIRQIMKSQAIICTAPERRKAEAVQACVEGPVSPLAPASILQKHEEATIYLDPDSAELLQKKYSAP